MSLNTYEKPYKYDVQKRVPDVSKAKDLLGFEAKTSLSKSLDEIIPDKDQLKLETFNCLIQI